MRSVNAVGMAGFFNLRRKIGAALAGAFLLSASTAVAEMRLLMFERDGCSYCAQWHEQIGFAYPKTAEGRAAPLQQIDIKDPLPEGVTLTGRAPVFTPTFILVDDGTEVARIEGYAGDEFFWVLLDQMLMKTGWTPEAETAEIPPQQGNATDE